MEDGATRMATGLGASFVATRIPWGTDSFPPLSDGTVDERVARESRYNRIFAALQAAGTRIIAFAHHADDQVETTIMRMSQNSGAKGLASMRPTRRWGMGRKDAEYYNFGAEGMETWIVRPFLQIPKVRRHADRGLVS